MRLIVGAGERHLRGFVHHDVQPLEGIDIVCEFFDLPNHVEAGSCEEIHMTHVLEHFPMAKVNEVLQLIHGLLSSGGKLYIEVPNFEWHCEQIVIDPSNRKIVEYAFGGQLNEWDFHYNGFTPTILREDLEDARFIVDNLAPNSSIECWAHKP